jgi:hypothetical protein
VLVTDKSKGLDADWWLCFSSSSSSSSFLFSLGFYTGYQRCSSCFFYIAAQCAETRMAEHLNFCHAGYITRTSMLEVYPAKKDETGMAPD